MKRRRRKKPAVVRDYEPPTEAERMAAAIAGATQLLADMGCDRTRNCGCDMCTESRTQRLKPDERKPDVAESPQLTLF